MQNEIYGQPSNNDHRENIRVENEILKLKMLAQFGGNMQINMVQPVPPEIENRFLKNIIAFDAGEKGVCMKLYDLLGRPPFKSANELNDSDISDELVYLMKLMSDKKLVLHMLGEYDNQTIYSFITEELFNHETSLDDGLSPDVSRHFIYEDFHPNHSYDIDNCCRQFMSDWFEQKFNDYSWELADKIILPDTTMFTRIEVLSKLKTVFEAYKYFTEQKFDIRDISFQLDGDNDIGLGHAEGYVHYNAILENNEVLPLEGSFKLYMSLEMGWWKIFHFIIPGFDLK